MRNIDFNKYQSALIIGNGFDLSLGLSTSYMDFVNSDEFQILLNMQNQLAIYLKVNAELHHEIDIENELKLYSKNEDNAKFKTEYEALCKQLVVYINNIDYSSINKNSKAYEVLTNLSSTKNNIILDFNYTASTRLILKQCGLSDEDIDNRLIKVHGEASNNDIIFGVEDNAGIKKEHVFLRKAYNIKYKALNFSELYDRIKSVAIFGHSLGETDHTYFNKLFQESCMYNKFSTNNNKEFWLFYYKENGYHCMMQQLDSLTHNSLTSFRQYNRVNFINTDKEKVFI